MPMKTMLETARRPRRHDAASRRRLRRENRRAGRARPSTWPTISPRRQVAHQPLRAGVAERAGQRAADLARDAERAAVASRGYRRTRSRRRGRAAPVGGKRSSHLRVPSVETCSATISGRASVKCSASAARRPLATFASREVAGAAEIDPVPELARRACGARARARRCRRGAPASSARVRPASDGARRRRRGGRRRRVRIRPCDVERRRRHGNSSVQGSELLISGGRGRG